MSMPKCCTCQSVGDGVTWDMRAYCVVCADRLNFEIYEFPEFWYEMDLLKKRNQETHDHGVR